MEREIEPADIAEQRHLSDISSEDYSIIKNCILDIDDGSIFSEKECTEIYKKTCENNGILYSDLCLVLRFYRKYNRI